MNTTIGRIARVPSRMAQVTGPACLLLLCVIATDGAARAQDGVWRQTPSNGSLTDGNNWDTATQPDMTGTGFFGASSITGLTLGTNMNVGGLTLTTGAGDYTLANSRLLALWGSGLTIHGGSLTITNAPNSGVGFYNSSSAGDATIINTGLSQILFTQQSTGGNARLVGSAAGSIDFSASTGPLGDNVLSAGSIEGDGDVFLGMNKLTVGGNNRSTTFSGQINDCVGVTGNCAHFPSNPTGGALVKTGTGTMTLTGANTYTGGTTFAGGTVSVSSDGNLGSGGNLTFDGGMLQITGTTFTSTARNIVWGANGGGFDIADAANTFDLTQDITGTGGLIKRGAGTLLLSGLNNSYTGLTDVQAGTLQLGSTGMLSMDSRHNIAAGATLDLNGHLFGAIGSLTGAGTVTTSAGDARLITAMDNTTATFSGTIKDGAAGKVEVWVGGFGSIGTAIFTGTNTYSGGTIICDCATLQLGNGGTTGSITGDVDNGGTLIFNRSNSYTFAGVISDSLGTGKLIQAGTGNTILTGLNTYTGPTIVNAGTLSVNGSIASSSLTTVNASGTLGGTGLVGDTRIDGGTLAPGNSIGTLHVQGNLVFTSAAQYMIEVDPAGADRTNVTGTARLDNAAVHATFAPGSYITRQYTILNAAGGVIGTFGNQVNTNLPTNFTSKLSYDTNNVYLDLTLNFVPPGPTPGPNYTPLNVNQAEVANALTGYFNRNGGIPLVFGALTPSGLSQVSGESATSLQQTSMQAMNLFLGVMTDATIAGRSGSAPAPAPTAFADEALAYAPRDAFGMVTKAVPRAPAFAARWNVWTAGFGGSQTTDGSIAQGSNTTTSRSYGFAVGADYLWAPQTVVGFALAGGGTTFSVANAGTGSSDMFQAGAYVRHTTGSAYVSAAAAYGWQDVTTDRTVTAAGFDRLRARFHANTFSGRIELGSRFAWPEMNGIGVTPYAGLQMTVLDLPAYAESLAAGAGNFALTYAARTVTAPRTELGLRSDKAFALDGALLTLRGRAAWAHDTNTERSAQATFQTLPGASFVVNGAAASRNTALTSASAEVTWLNGFSLAATFDGEFSETTRSYAGKGVVRYAW